MKSHRYFHLNLENKPTPTTPGSMKKLKTPKHTENR